MENSTIDRGLTQLRDIHLPDPVLIWPPAMGWWILAAIIMALVVALWLGIFIRRRGLAHHALKELSHLEKDRSGHGDLQSFATAVSGLLRRVALARYGRSRVASLTDRDWLQFLSQSGRTQRSSHSWNGDAGRLLAIAPYAPPGALEIKQLGFNVTRQSLAEAARGWIRKNT
ncbi:MAG: DUF4381 domain-containing protein [Pseudomonadota bacterium]